MEIKHGDVFEYPGDTIIWVKDSNYHWKLFCKGGACDDELVIEWAFHFDSEHPGNRVMNIFTGEKYNSES